ncbi:MAG: hypothetical protein HQ486_06525 [Acidimicrobiaceae bacterium]|nr:hypothetical protein [Acidimicrobiaceae bacterium]
MRTILAMLVLGFAAVLGFVVKKRRPDAPTQSLKAVPQQLNRKDFLSPESAWLVAVFTSSTCDACRDVVTKAKVLASHDVAVQVLDYPGMRALHERYAIEAVPTTVIADSHGIVQYGIIGPVTAADLWAAMAKLTSRV